MNFFIRLLTGIVYVLVLTIFVLLRRIDILFFDFLIALFALCGFFEMSRAVGEHTDKPQKVIAGVFSVGIIVCFALCDALLPKTDVNFAPHLTFALFITGVATLFGLLVFRHEQTSLESTGYALLTLSYPALFLLALSMVNHAPEKYAEIGIIFTFVICPFADCAAYLFGMLLGKKFPKKMSPHVSPNKTVVGGIGGILGGGVGALALFYVYYGLIAPNVLPLSVGYVLFFVGLGVLTAFFSTVGDLVESAIKRKIGIKDMGKILPGHGGILDRIDSSLYASLIVAFVILIASMLGA